MKNKTTLIAIILWLFISTAINPENVNATSPGANLNQARNGTDLLPTNPVQWVNGNLGGSQAHYVEGMSSPYQCVMTFLTPGSQVIITIGYDIMNSDRHAFDYLTHYNRILPHGFLLHSTPEVIDPLNGTGLGSGTPFTTYTIPLPSSAGSPVAGQPGISYNALTTAERKMTLFNGTIDTIYYAVQGSLTASTSETQIVVKFTPSNATAVLAWGGHLGSRNDWGSLSGNPNSAGGISGSPFHMRLISWSYGSLGSQDRSLAGGSVSAPPAPLPVELIHFGVVSEGNTNIIEWTTASEINNAYFSVQRSSGLINFETVATIRGAGNSSTIKNYSWTDNNPLSGLSYYRLIQTDYNGAQKIFDTVNIRSGETYSPLSIINVYPNPILTDFSVTYHSENKSATLIEIVDINGKHIYSEILKSIPGTNRFQYREKNLLPAGIYFITLSQGETKPVTKMIIKK